MKEVTFKMKINRSFSLLARTTVAVVAVTLVGCASFATSTPEQLVKNRSTEFWRARIAGDTAKAYALSTPSYRKVKTAEQYKTQFGGNVGTQSAEVTNVSCEPTRCTVTLKLDVKPAIPGINIGIVPMYMDEVWLLEDGQWWHFQEV